MVIQIFVTEQLVIEKKKGTEIVRDYEPQRERENYSKEVLFPFLAIRLRAQDTYEGCTQKELR